MNKANEIQIKVMDKNMEISTFIRTLEEFETKYRIYRKLQVIKTEIDKRIEIEYKLAEIKPEIMKTQKKIKKLWADDINREIIVDIPDGLDAVILVLLWAWPDCLSEGELSRRTKPAESTIGDWLRGTKRNSGHYFTKCKTGGYTLTSEGCEFAIKDVAPRVLGETILPQGD